MSNLWLEILLADHEAHMSPPGIEQAQFLPAVGETIRHLDVSAINRPVAGHFLTAIHDPLLRAASIAL